MARTSLTEKDEFVNKSDGWIGVVQLDHQGAAGGIAVEPGGSAFMSEEEQILTANAPRSDSDNPFANGALVLRTRSVDIKQRRPWGAAETTPEETGAAPLPAGPAPEGSRPVEEEVATPEAAQAPAVVKAPATMRKRSK